jgi:putative N6-adenine-specific DNA methylase
VSDCQKIIKKAVVERLKETYAVPWFEESGALYQIQFSIMKNRAHLMIDTSGRGLHKRGYRPEANAAPLKETLAAALCEIAHLKPYHTLYDPMCGSGTILIEGALMALGVAPGIQRRFTADTWRQVPPEIWQEERRLARAMQRTDVEFHAYGSDIDEAALAAARQNAKRAGVEKFITFEKKDVRDFAPVTEKATVIVNPPYGERLLDDRQAKDLYKVLGERFRPARGRSYTVITSDEDFERSFGRRADKRRKLYNGMIKCQVYMYFK